MTSTVNGGDTLTEPGPAPTTSGTADLGSVALYYETFGTGEEYIVLVNGLTSQLLAYPAEFCALLADEGYTVVRFDNRDVGWSSVTAGDPPPVSTDRRAVPAEPPPYTLSDMASDVTGLLDHLGIDRAHVVGVSMGGMIVQHLAIEHPSRLVSATSIMSTTGDPDVGRSTAEAVEALFAPAPADVDEAIEQAVAIGRIWGGDHFDDDRARDLARLAHHRSVRPAAALFQMAAVRASGDRTGRLRQVDVPFLVIHGLQDTLLDLDGGEATALAVPGAKLRVMRDLGHALAQAPTLWPRLVRAIVRHSQDAQHAEGARHPHEAMASTSRERT